MTRPELYALIWSASIRSLSVGLGLSDMGLAKLCARYDIPIPPRGNGARKGAGQAPAISPLPVRSTDEVIHRFRNLEANGRLKPYDDRLADLLAPVAITPPHSSSLAAATVAHLTAAPAPAPSPAPRMPSPAPATMHAQTSGPHAARAMAIRLLPDPAHEAPVHTASPTPVADDVAPGETGGAGQTAKRRPCRPPKGQRLSSRG